MPDPASWIPRGFLLALFLYAVNRNVHPPLGWDVFRQSTVPGGEVEILGVGRHSATVVFIQLRSRCAGARVALAPTCMLFRGG